jgi:predicted Holliday junction resolvase-like endonuclease
MARGWDSKSVEDQIGAAEADRDAQIKPHLSTQERERRTRRESLLLSRAQIIGRLKGVTNTRYRAQLEKTLKQLDEQLREEETQ